MLLALLSAVPVRLDLDGVRALRERDTLDNQMDKAVEEFAEKVETERLRSILERFEGPKQ
jgi:hypothetical protein